MTKRRKCRIFLVLLILIAALIMGALVLAVISLRPKLPTISVESISVDGVAPRITFPDFHVQLNVTLHMVVRVDNPNRVGFTIREANTALFFNSVQVGEVVAQPTDIPAKASNTIAVDVTLDADKLTTNDTFVDEVKKGVIHLESRTSISGKLFLLGFIRRTILVQLHCQTSISISDLKVLDRSCTRKTDL